MKFDYDDDFAVTSVKKGGGGRKDFAQAGGVDQSKIEQAFEAVRKKLN